ncbi:Hydra magnipapillata [Nesidiocoris tenuis]|uniref:Hydra magnipapillata n=1 Tax=Nesidiocoris tenuis TaxID=355587 RepID=A0ABN7ARG3_9HEMI|nr:Hydra magnipapillata [Nesidiocoris tenuis]
MSSTVNYRIDPLTKENWDTWKLQAQAILIKSGLWKFVNGTEKYPHSFPVLKEKFNADGTLERKKARLVARGFTQRPNVDFAETYAPVAKLSSIRLLLGIAAEKGLMVSQMDVITAYLNGDLDEDVYMAIPENLKQYLQEIVVEESQNETVFEKARKALNDLRNGDKEKVCHLKKAIYGLRQAGRQWFKKLDSKLKEIGFNPSIADPCIYRSSTGGGEIIAVYVDDLIILTKDQAGYEKLKSILLKCFDMRDLGSLNYCLGIQFSCKNECVSANQSKYIDKLLEKYQMTDCKPIGTPMDPKTKLEKATDCDQQSYPYQNLIGALMYLSVATRPDISYTVSYLSQFNNSFGKEHWQAAKRVLKYLKGTKEMSLLYRKTSQPIVGYTDADWGSCTIDRRSYSGFCFIFAGSPICWAAKKQTTVALSTAEAEYAAIAESTKEALHLKQLSMDLDITQNKIVIHNDNQAAQHMAANPIISSKSKHVAIRINFVREVIERGDVELKYVSTDLMTADVLTKALAKPRHQELIANMGLTTDHS